MKIILEILILLKLFNIAIVIRFLSLCLCAKRQLSNIVNVGGHLKNFCEDR